MVLTIGNLIKVTVLLEKLRNPPILFYLFVGPLVGYIAIQLDLL